MGIHFLTIPLVDQALDGNVASVVVGAALTLLAVAGVWLIYHPVAPGQRTATLLMCLALATVAFYVAGFAIAMGGAAGRYAGLGDLSSLTREWTPFGPGRGIAGSAGFLLAGSASSPAVYALFVWQAPLFLLAAVVALSSWVHRVPRVAAVVFSVLFGALLYPLFTNWVWGGGWLAALGQTAGFGHGVVDFAGAAVVNATAGLCALGALTAIRGQEQLSEETETTPLTGLIVVVVGWMGLVMACTAATNSTDLATAAANVLVAAISGSASALVYTWFAAGEPDASAGAWGGLAGLVAVSAGAPFYPAWAAAVVGGVAGLLALLMAHLLVRLVSDRIGASVVAVHGVAGLWGLLAVGLAADGRNGIGWNGIGEREYLGALGQGVTGLFPGDLVVADPTQLTAQLVGAAVVLAFPLATWLFVRAALAISALRQSAPLAAAEQAPPDVSESSDSTDG